MATLNRVTLIGNLGKDFDTRYTPNCDAVTKRTYPSFYWSAD
ncbi:MAG: single-stranded DNA-binding protein [Nitrosospira sp.]|nr:single-stranded DNA-binding protein [Nitrosospira sp.]